MKQRYLQREGERECKKEREFPSTGLLHFLSSHNDQSWVGPKTRACRISYIEDQGPTSLGHFIGWFPRCNNWELDWKWSSHNGCRQHEQRLNIKVTAPAPLFHFIIKKMFLFVLFVFDILFFMIQFCRLKGFPLPHSPFFMNPLNFLYYYISIVLQQQSKIHYQKTLFLWETNIDPA